MSVHISAQKGEIAQTVLLPGDPLRAQYIAENYLEKAKLVSQTRNIFYYTGTYKDKEITVGASGMGIPSIGIYSYELFTEYDVENIIRIGTCGAYTSELNLFDLINVEQAASESTYALHAWEMDEEILKHQGKIFDTINEVAASANIQTVKTNVHTSDIFYRKSQEIPPIALKHQCAAVEMEAFALFANAKYTGKNAATLLTVSDIIPTGEHLSADERQRALRKMMELALDSASKL
ncbi:purine-nucleoside phosphorylase [Bergeyella sp. RCAD1439]|uniref:purine-nucleoside phosphorylase n=1 Tax=Bergeyella anatis TaxID=3113737 RepID=UPI002E1753CC|nr:purine-nucleoside phosphorylase [Bergeyella sp. RCAD1439]